MCVDVLYKSEAMVFKYMFGTLTSVIWRGPRLLGSRGTAGQNPGISQVLGLSELGLPTPEWIFHSVELGRPALALD